MMRNYETWFVKKIGNKFESKLLSFIFHTQLIKKIYTKCSSSILTNILTIYMNAYVINLKMLKNPWYLSLAITSINIIDCFTMKALKYHTPY